MNFRRTSRSYRISAFSSALHIVITTHDKISRAIYEINII